MLDIFLLKRNIKADGGPQFDATHGFVIIADTEKDARMMAANYREDSSDTDRRDRDENPEVWFSDSTTCRVVGTSNLESGVILEDHQWG